MRKFGFLTPRLVRTGVSRVPFSLKSLTSFLSLTQRLNGQVKQSCVFPFPDPTPPLLRCRLFLPEPFKNRIRSQVSRYLPPSLKASPLDWNHSSSLWCPFSLLFGSMITPFLKLVDLMATSLSPRQPPPFLPFSIQWSNLVIFFFGLLACCLNSQFVPGPCGGFLWLFSVSLSLAVFSRRGFPWFLCSFPHTITFMTDSTRRGHLLPEPFLRSFCTPLTISSSLPSSPLDRVRLYLHRCQTNPTPSVLSSLPLPAGFPLLPFTCLKFLTPRRMFFFAGSLPLPSPNFSLLP